MYSIKIKINHIAYKYENVEKIKINNNKIYITTKNKVLYVELEDVNWFNVERI